MAGIYLHIPFCKQACTYCNFHFSTSLQRKGEMLEALLRELTMQRHYLQDRPIETIYFGGGTPSLLTSDEIKRLTETIYLNYNVTDLKEFTLEANPDDLDTAYLKTLKTTAVTRLSVGVQSFRETDLLYMNRAHNVQQADYSIKAAQDAGFTNLTIDLIYGTPGLTDADWLYNLSRLTALQIPHFSAYALTVEEGTALDHAIKKKKAIPVDAAQAAGQFEILMAQAPLMGYDHYEISNFALPGMYAVHNTNYWRGIPYIGIGPSAHSFNGKERRWNVANNALYTKNILQDNTLMYENEVLTRVQHLNEYIMTSLRTMWGCDLDKVRNEWGNEYAEQVIESSYEFREKKWLIEKEGKLIVTDAGKLFADRIAGEMFTDEIK
ncbi:MAG: radical SAM family heme chaperone HemW [Flavipsychrobacter sp.]|nr:radical SAM family heme chaperone HemW [Flavipsychrobacter sp.]